VKVLTVCEPWATAIIRGPKRIENRPWPTNHRGPLLIHAGKGHHWLHAFVSDLHGQRDSLPEFEALREHFRFGFVIGTVDVIDCLPVLQVARQRFAWGPWCWILANPKPLAVPFRWRGSLGLQNIPDELLKEAA